MSSILPFPAPAAPARRNRRVRGGNVVDFNSYLKLRTYVYNREGGKCAVCGTQLNFGTFHLSHRIPQTKRNLKTYGKAVLHHPKNLRGCCGHACNDRVSISNHPIEIQQLLREIQEDLNENDGKWSR